MRIDFFVILAFSLACPPAHADAYRCRNANGTVVISSTPCGDADTTHVVRSSQANPQALERAQNDLERQKQFVAQREQERTAEQARHASVAQARKVSGDAYDPDTRNRIHACLMKVTATLGLSPTAQAQRKVNCYLGTVGLRDECEGRITATGGLTTNQEQHFRQQCRNLS
jgi:hypothetical protein